MFVNSVIVTLFINAVILSIFVNAVSLTMLTASIYISIFVNGVNLTMVVNATIVKDDFWRFSFVFECSTCINNVKIQKTLLLNLYVIDYMVTTGIAFLLKGF